MKRVKALIGRYRPIRAEPTLPRASLYEWMILNATLRCRRTNGTSFSENVYIAWLYGEFRGGRMLDYIDEHSFNEHKLTCFTATYTTAHIFIEFELAVW